LFGEKCQNPSPKLVVWGMRNEGFTKLTNQIMLFLTSNSSLSFEARDLKVWIQTASSFVQKNTPFGFFIFCPGAENEGFYEANKPDQTSKIMLLLTSNISSLRQNIKKLVSRFCAINMRIIPNNFDLCSFKTVGGNRGDRQTFFTNSTKSCYNS